MYTLFGFVIGSIAGSMIKTRDPYAKLSSSFLMGIGGIIGMSVGFGFGLAKMSAGTHYISRWFKNSGFKNKT